MLNTNQINTYLVGIFMYQCINKELPTMFVDMFKYTRDLSHYETRHSDNLYVPMHRTNARKCSVAVHGSKVWNSIPADIKLV